MEMDKIIKANPEILAATEDKDTRARLEKERRASMRKEARGVRRLREKKKGALALIDTIPSTNAINSDASAAPVSAEDQRNTQGHSQGAQAEETNPTQDTNAEAPPAERGVYHQEHQGLRVPETPEAE